MIHASRGLKHVVGRSQSLLATVGDNGDLAPCRLVGGACYAGKQADAVHRGQHGHTCHLRQSRHNVRQVAQVRRDNACGRHAWPLDYHGHVPPCFSGIGLATNIRADPARGVDGGVEFARVAVVTL